MAWARSPICPGAIAGRLRREARHDPLASRRESPNGESGSLRHDAGAGVR
jgi:hypothetical protein